MTKNHMASGGTAIKSPNLWPILCYGRVRCSLTIQRGDLSIANMIAAGLFGDGAAAVLLVGDNHELAKS